MHEECENQFRLYVMLQYIKQHPESLAIADNCGDLPLHILLIKRSSSIDIALMMIGKNPAALQHRDNFGNLPLHIECLNQCRSSIISQCIELYPEALAIHVADGQGYLPLHSLIHSKSSTVKDALMMIEKYPAPLQHPNYICCLPLRIECSYQCRPSIIMRCIELYPESVDDDTICSIFDKINEHNYHRGSGYRWVVTMIFTIRPMNLYRLRASKINDIRSNPDYRRRILNLLPGHVFTPRHEIDYRDLNWQPRAAMMMLWSQMKI
jgi:hypothetical protein